MPCVRVLPHPALCPNGHAFDAQRGTSLCESLLASGIALEHACEMVAACATCHVYVREGGASLAPPDDEENDQLDRAWGLDAQSRLACCVSLGNDDLTIELPRHTRNLARER
ncbi:2Fe-2S ferredoxin [Burkholderia vietnamiensis]|jgi:2Fe-2S ferredoxin|uniref:2Fe-2S iron-sulfur cluster-binding protein n=1 Tax=Burkholderia vietnamiensis TaxID=60552 RepID=UPI00075E490A|nr:2Fe-2S iron-sulfur cluster-binding protein [Burkholderia vietnamiensis]KVG11503.1 2Fe-2S ferredoxin [Burkholderia vietnamiensis]MBR8357154.1 2Fe-2S iron-sulfur cluster binding domain-containing protein [Burkholderia vietnamiensis]